MKKYLLRFTALTVALLAGFTAFSFAACGESPTDETNDGITDKIPDSPSEPDKTDNPDDVKSDDNPAGDSPYALGDWNYYSYEYVDTNGSDASMEYAVYIPASYDGQTELPLLTYIPDARYCTRKLTTIVSSAEGPTAWLTDENKAENPAIWLIPRVTNANSCDASINGSQAAQIVPIVDKVIEEFSVDENRLYLTGHSMGGIFFFSVNDVFPNKFTATVYVACQPGGTVYDDQYNAIIANQAYVNQTFIYIASRKDDKAPYGQDDITDVLDENGIEYGLLYGFSPDDEDLEEKISTVLNLGYSQNFLGFESVVSTGETEHVGSFAPSYAINAIYEWLFAQSKSTTN